MPLRELWCRPFTDARHTKQVLGKPLVRTLALLPSSPAEEVVQGGAPVEFMCGFWCFGGSGSGALGHKNSTSACCVYCCTDCMYVWKLQW